MNSARTELGTSCACWMWSSKGGPDDCKSRRIVGLVSLTILKSLPPSFDLIDACPTSLLRSESLLDSSAHTSAEGSSCSQLRR